MKRKWLVPEVVQTSAMDCGPASLKALLEGHGVNVSYGRLREACQTDVDGTSIDTLEQTAVALGLDAAQVMLPLDHVLHPAAAALPALIVVRHPNGATHFVIVWRRHGQFVQIMDPAVGRRFVSIRQLLSEVHLHTMAVPAAAWREWAGTDAFTEVIDARMQALGIGAAERREHLARALEDESWMTAGRLDAAVRMVEALARDGAIDRGRVATRLVAKLVAGEAEIPETFWAVRACDGDATSVVMTGAVLVSVTGRGESATATEGLSPDLAAALVEPPSRPGIALLRMLWADGALAPALLVPVMALAAAGVVIEALLLRALFDLTRELTLSGQRLVGIGAILAFFIMLLCVEWPLASALLRMGRKLEARLRIAFLTKIPRLGDRYFHSRLTSDMAERSHAVHTIRALPQLGGALARSVFELVFTAAGIAWLFPASAWWAVGIAAVSVVLPIAVQPLLAARDLRWRTHTGALSRFYLDAMLGLVPIRAHGAERALRREQEGMLGEWARAGLKLQRAVVGIEGVQFLVGLGLAAWLLLRHLQPGGDAAGVLLLAYWALNLPMLGQEIGAAAWQYPGLRNTTLRLMEPLGAPEEAVVECNGSGRTGGVSIELKDVVVRASGHLILHGVNLRIGAGEHVAIVGPSGAGKSSLVGLLLGWHKPSEGAVVVDGAALDAAGLADLRMQTAWVDPQVRLWNRSLLDNLQYGATGERVNLERAINDADLRGVLRRLPDGLQSVLGEGGALVSGGEGQRVRFGRALAKQAVRLAILDEPARGLDREKRRVLLERARETWPQATILCITHDVADTLEFPRVLVIESARIAEDGNPRELASQTDSRYRALLDAEHQVRRGLWASSLWRRLRLQSGALVEEQRKETTACVAR